MVVQNGAGSGATAGKAVAASKPADKAASRPAKSNLPFWLLALGGVAMIAAFAHGAAERGIDAPFDGISFDLGDATKPSADPADDGYSATRPSNHAFAMLRLADGRFVALYGPHAADAAAPPLLAGLLVGDGEERSGAFSSGNVHDFSLEAGALRVAAQEGRFAPSRFVEGETLRADASPDADRAAAPMTGAYAGRLADANGAGPATLTVAADGTLLIAADHCSARGTVAARAGAAVWRLRATFEAGCAHHGDTLQGHAWRRGDQLYAVLPTPGLNGGAVFTGSALAPK